jgi:hypothetical protein
MESPGRTCHIRPMAEFHPNQPNGQHKCEHCGALYDVKWGSLPARDSDKAYCDCCKELMGKWNSTRFPMFTLVGECPGHENVRFLDDR